MITVNNNLLKAAVSVMLKNLNEPVATNEGDYSLLFVHGTKFSFLWAHDPLNGTDHYSGRFLGEDIKQFHLQACVVGSPVKGAFRILLQAANKDTGEAATFMIGDENDTGEKVYAWLILGSPEKGLVPLKSFSIIEDGPDGSTCFLGEHLSRKRKGRLEFMLALLHHFADTALDLKNLIKGGSGDG